MKLLSSINFALSTFSLLSSTALGSGTACTANTDCATGYTCTPVSATYSQCVRSAPPSHYSSLRRRQALNYTEITGAGPDVHPRLPISELRTSDPDAWTLFLLSLSALQREPESADESYYQVSGIHGRPFIGWQHPDHTGNWGYCTHESVIFATWHRPYLILFEQLLVKHATAIASNRTSSSGGGGGNSSTDGMRWSRAAQRLRLPYWDWASEDTQSRIPTEMTTATIEVDGGRTIPNPLFRYAFQRADYRANYFGGTVWADIETTVRPAEVSDWLEGEFPSRKLATLALFTIANFSTFSTTQLGSSGSAEGIHNAIHGAFGPDGHMASVDVSSFDPIFWLHHANVDRLTAMYQVVNPGSGVDPTAVINPTIGNPGLQTEDENTPLYPFRQKGGADWTSVDVEEADSIWKYGYSYPEVPTNMTGDALREFTLQAIDRLYAPKPSTPEFAPVPSSPSSPSASSPASPPLKNGTATTSSAGLLAPPTATAAPDATVRTEWRAQVSFDGGSIQGTFSLSFYIGTLSSAVTPKSLVGSMASFSSSSGSSSSSSSSSSSTILNGVVPLTPALVENGQSLDPASAVGWLRQNLNWKVLAGGKEVEGGVERLGSSLSVRIESAEVMYFDEPGKLPEAGTWRSWDRVTEGKKGGGGD